jgi:hypothetical protein
VRVEEQVLELLESREDALLSWGVVEGGFEEDELISILDDWLMKNDPVTDAYALVDRMRLQGLLFRDLSTQPPRWRTRSAETLRLTARLRQMFPGEGNGDGWRRGAPLVADFRYLRRPRSYPRRDQSLEGITEPLPNLSPPQVEALRLLTTASAGPMLLSGFQVRATRQVLSAAAGGRSTGIVVGAGTGSGKTLAFYLPAFAHLAGLDDGLDWTRAVAVYPRNELLRDQLGNAFRNARQVDDLFRRIYGRPLRVTAYYGPTPERARSLDGQYGAWQRSAGGFRCPYLSCPHGSDTACAGDLVWPDDDRRRGLERLVCRSCGAAFEEDVVVLTRERMKRQPPDVVFTTTEMLNRSLSDLPAGAVFGVGVRRPPVLMLLDEIHTYGGTSGAQAAMVLRRWRNRLRSHVTFVGLSATLVDAASYFSDLTGLQPDEVVNIEPDAEELQYEGAEHLVALRSDPTTGVSVLSTTIQASMLLPRTLDPPALRPSQGLYGSKMFVFTDDLDVTNRLYYDLLDAEGQRLDGKGRPQGYKDALATLRDPTLGGGPARRAAGQSWDLPETLGHSIGSGSRLPVGRTSSQDVGVDQDAQVIVATAALEVGFDDPEVGAVLQHKAPRDVAQFVQRKGRAGRPRGMRPWTTVVLSDYGRDRAAYEAWDALFDPVLPARSLPVRNRAVLRMHAVQSLLDWTSERLRTDLPGAQLWRDLTRERDASQWGMSRGRVQDQVAALMERLLEDVALQSDLARWIGRALQLQPAEVNELLWHPPRPVLLAAVPALQRRLRSQWAVAGEDGRRVGRDQLGGNPLPDYFPSNLFSDLALPEAIVKVPAQLQWETAGDEHGMGIAQVLREFAPGRVSRRFATRTMRHRHWVPLPQDPQGSVNVEAAFPEHDLEVHVDVVMDGRQQSLQLIRPHSVAVEVVPDEVRDSSNAFLHWGTQLVERGQGSAVRVPREDAIGRHISGVRFHLHAQNAHVEARRAALSADATLQLGDGTERRARPSFAAADGTRVVVGAVFDVDGVRLDVDLPIEHEVSEPVRRGLRSAWFRHVLTSDPQLLEHANIFQLGWLHEALEITLIRRAVEESITLEVAFDRTRDDLVHHLDTTMEVLFQRVGLVVDDVDVNAGPARLHGRLRALLEESSFAARIGVLSSQMWQPDGDAMRAWLRRRLLATTGQAALASARLMCPEHDPEGLVVDVEPGVGPEGRPRAGEVWLSERSIGGGGFLEAFAARLQRDPRRFLRLMRRAIRPSTTEIIDRELRRILDALGQEGPLPDAVARYRGAASQADRVRAFRRVREALGTVGVVPHHTVVSALANRLLRPGTTSATDRAVAQVVAAWDEEEQRIGVEIGVRTWAFLSSSRGDLDYGLALSGGGDLRQRRLDAIQSLLWPRGWRMRAEALQSWNPYSALPDPAPDVLRELVADDSPIVDVGEEAVAQRVRDLLAQDGVARIGGSAAEAGSVSDLLVELVTHPVETEFLRLHPRVAEVERTADGGTVVSLELMEIAP